MSIGLTHDNFNVDSHPNARVAASDVWESGELRIELRHWVVRRAGAEVRVTRKEFGLLRLLVSAGGAPIARSDLWQKQSQDLPNSSRSLDSHIWSLRLKVEEDPSDPRHLLTLLRYGYRLV
jgi:DNA-binding response OmpR family regulator